MTSILAGLPCTGTAVISPCGTYRYHLTRTWLPDPTAPRLLWIMLNPSTADAAVLDPTVRGCCLRAIEWGFGSIEVVNLFALRSPYPTALTRHAEPIGERGGNANDDAIHVAAARAHTIIAAWGVHGSIGNRSSRVLEDLVAIGRHRLHAVAITRCGQPGHPLYLKRSLRPFLYHRPTDSSDRVELPCDAVDSPRQLTVTFPTP